jgi:hypothetical protein
MKARKAKGDVCLPISHTPVLRIFIALFSHRTIPSRLEIVFKTTINLGIQAHPPHGWHFGEAQDGIFCETQAHPRGRKKQFSCLLEESGWGTFIRKYSQFVSSGFNPSTFPVDHQICDRFEPSAD